MVDKLISDLDAAGTLLGTELVELETAGGDSVKGTLDEILALAGGGGGAGGGGTFEENWAFSTTAADADPGAGNFRLDTTSVATATKIIVHKTASGSVDMTALLDALPAGDIGYTTRIRFRPISGLVAEFYDFRITAKTDHTTYVTFTGTCVQSDNYNQPTRPTNAAAMALTFSIIPFNANLAPGNIPSPPPGLTLAGIPGLLPYRTRSLTLTASRTYFTPFRIKRPTYIQGCETIVTTLQASRNIRRAIYDTNPISRVPRTKLWEDAAAVSVASTGNKSAIVGIRLNPGYYFLATSGDASLSTAVIAAAEALVPFLGIVSGGAVIEVPNSFHRASDETAGFQATWSGALTATQAAPSFADGGGLIVPSFLTYIEGG